MAEPTHEQRRKYLPLARRVAADDASYAPALAAAILAGTLDDYLGVRTALAAIIETTERAAAASLADQLEAWLHTAPDQDIVYFGTAVLIALRNGAHITGAAS